MTLDYLRTRQVDKTLLLRRPKRLKYNGRLIVIHRNRDKQEAKDHNYVK